ncbi:MAG: hypothetical protein K0S08_1258 [Gammaproteobacteria bacterium]|jgi:ankyrin repeat protein|nr:hypothetical protein [Gammaproteobacteria bacterium]
MPYQTEQECQVFLTAWAEKVVAAANSRWGLDAETYFTQMLFDFVEAGGVFANDQGKLLLDLSRFDMNTYAPPPIIESSQALIDKEKLVLRPENYARLLAKLILLAGTLSPKVFLAGARLEVFLANTWEVGSGLFEMDLQYLMHERNKLAQSLDQSPEAETCTVVTFSGKIISYIPLNVQHSDYFNYVFVNNKRMAYNLYLSNNQDHARDAVEGLAILALAEFGLARIRMTTWQPQLAPESIERLRRSASLIGNDEVCEPQIPKQQDLPVVPFEYQFSDGSNLLHYFIGVKKPLASLLPADNIIWEARYNAQLIYYLVQNGVDIHKPNQYGITPADLLYNAYLNGMHEENDAQERLLLAILFLKRINVLPWNDIPFVPYLLRFPALHKELAQYFPLKPAPAQAEQLLLNSINAQNLDTCRALLKTFKVRLASAWTLAAKNQQIKFLQLFYKYKFGAEEAERKIILDSMLTAMQANHTSVVKYLYSLGYVVPLDHPIYVELILAMKTNSEAQAILNCFSEEDRSKLVDLHEETLFEAYVQRRLNARQIVMLKTKTRHLPPSQPGIPPSEQLDSLNEEEVKKSLDKLIAKTIAQRNIELYIDVIRGSELETSDFIQALFHSDQWEEFKLAVNKLFDDLNNESNLVVINALPVDTRMELLALHEEKLITAYIQGKVQLNSILSIVPKVYFPDLAQQFMAAGKSFKQYFQENLLYGKDIEIFKDKFIGKVVAKSDVKLWVALFINGEFNRLALIENIVGSPSWEEFKKTIAARSEGNTIIKEVWLQAFAKEKMAYLADFGLDRKLSGDKTLLQLFLQEKLPVAQIKFIINNMNKKLIRITDVSLALSYDDQKNRQEIVDQLLTEELDLNEVVNKDEDTVLHQAARINDIALVKILLEKNANPLKKNRTGESSLSLAFYHHKAELFNALLEKVDAAQFKAEFPELLKQIFIKCNAPSIEQKRCVKALIAKHPTLAMAVVEGIANNDRLVDAFGNTLKFLDPKELAHFALENYDGKSKLFASLLTKKVFNKVLTSDCSSKSPNLLFEALVLGKTDLIPVMLKSGCITLIVANSEGFTPIHLMIRYTKNIEIVKALIAYADKHAKAIFQNKVEGYSLVDWCDIWKEENKLALEIKKLFITKGIKPSGKPILRQDLRRPDISPSIFASRRLLPQVTRSAFASPPTVPRLESVAGPASPPVERTDQAQEPTIAKEDFSTLTVTVIPPKKQPTSTAPAHSVFRPLLPYQKEVQRKNQIKIAKELVVTLTETKQLTEEPTQEHNQLLQLYYLITRAFQLLSSLSEKMLCKIYGATLDAVGRREYFLNIRGKLFHRNLPGEQLIPFDFDHVKTILSQLWPIMPALEQIANEQLDISVGLCTLPREGRFFNRLEELQSLRPKEASEKLQLTLKHLAALSEISTNIEDYRSGTWLHNQACALIMLLDEFADCAGAEAKHRRDQAFFKQAKEVRNAYAHAKEENEYHEIAGKMTWEKPFGLAEDLCRLIKQAAAILSQTTTARLSLQAI